MQFPCTLYHNHKPYSFFLAFSPNSIHPHQLNPKPPIPTTTKLKISPVVVRKKMSSRVIGILIFLAIAAPINGLNTRKLDDTTVPVPPDAEMKCGSCPCNNPCGQSPPPPPPPPPPPKKPPTPSLNCPPPPSQYIYISGPPGNLYPVDPYFTNTGRSLGVALPLLVGCALVGLFAYW